MESQSIRKWSVRFFEQDDEEKIYHLHKKVFLHVEDKKKWFTWWKWQHLDNPNGLPLIWFADAGNELAGQYEMVKMRVRYQNREIDACHSQDTMTHPDYRRQGIFETLANKTYEQGNKEGVKFVFGFPNQNSYPGFINKLDFLEICKVPNVFKPLNIKRTLEHKLNIGPLTTFLTIFVRIFFGLYRKSPSPREIEGLRFVNIQTFDDRFDDLWKRVSGSYGTMVVRNKEHLNWRYKRIPHRDYTIIAAEKDDKILGYIVLAIVKKVDFIGGEIIDIFAEPRINLVRNLLKRAQEHFEKNEVDAMYCWLPRMKVYEKSFRKQGFLPFTSSPVFIVKKIGDDIDEDHLKKYSNWFISMGDSDFH